MNNKLCHNPKQQNCWLNSNNNFVAMSFHSLKNKKVTTKLQFFIQPKFFFVFFLVIKRENTNFLKANRSVSLQNLSNRQSIPPKFVTQSINDESDFAENPETDINVYINSDFESVLDENLSLSDTSSLGAVSQTDLSCRSKMRLNVVNEIQQTEKNYIKNLKSIVEVSHLKYNLKGTNFISTFFLI